MARRAFVAQRIITPEGVRAGAVIVQDGQIEAIEDVAPEGMPSVDLGAEALLPGLVDTHVHINEPGRTEWEGFVTATQAAAAGGITSLVDMPLNCDPVTTSLAALEIKLASLEGDTALHVDTGFWGGVVPGNAHELAALAERGVLGCKAFLCDSGLDEFPASSEDDLRAAMPVLRDARIPLLAHAELDLGHAPCPVGSTSHDAWLSSRPAAWEDAAIELLISLCRETRCAVHIVHLSSSSALPMIRAAKDEGLPLTVETCPHYLCLTADEVPDGETVYKCAPPIRNANNREALWAGLGDGTIDFVISDHSPCTPGLKRLDTGDFGGAWGGISSLSLGLPSIWGEGSRRGHSLEQISRWLSTEPARFAGLSNKGAIAPGMDADLCAFDADAPFTVREDDLHFRHRVSPYLGKSLRGRVSKTWLRGEQVYERGADSPFSPALGRALLSRR